MPQFKISMRWRIIASVLLVLTLLSLAGFAHFWWGWWQPSRPVTPDSPGNYTDQGEAISLDEALAVAHEALDEIDRKIKDYSAVLVKQERIGDTLVEKKMCIKLRQKPFSVYLYFLEREQ